MRASGISTGFPVLSRSSGQVPHVLLTRSPLSTRASPGFSFDLHVLGAPPAFVLSQDQTLHRDLDHLPGLREGPSIRESPGPDHCSGAGNVARWPPRWSHRAELQVNVSGRPSPRRGSDRTPALAFGVTIPFSRSRIADALAVDHDHPGAEQTLIAGQEPEDRCGRAPLRAAASGRCRCQCRSPPAGLARPDPCSGRTRHDTDRAPGLQAGSTDFFNSCSHAVGDPPG